MCEVAGSEVKDQRFANCLRERQRQTLKDIWVKRL